MDSKHPDSSAALGLKQSPDDTIISIGFEDELMSDVLLNFRSPERLRKSMYRGMWKEKTSERRIAADADYRRELQQYVTALAVGVPVDQMVFQAEKRENPRRSGDFKPVRYSADPQLTLQFKGAKLAIAAIYAAPEVPSDFDMKRLEQFGYDSIVDITDRIVDWNKAGNQPPIPLPGSILPSPEHIRWEDGVGLPE